VRHKLYTATLGIDDSVSRTGALCTDISQASRSQSRCSRTELARYYPSIYANQVVGGAPVPFKEDIFVAYMDFTSRIDRANVFGNRPGRAEAQDVCHGAVPEYL
jgi:hypothetical protein